MTVLSTLKGLIQEVTGYLGDLFSQMAQKTPGLNQLLSGGNGLRGGTPTPWGTNNTAGGFTKYASLSLYKNGSEYRSVGWFAPPKNDSTNTYPAIFSNVFPIDLDDSDYIDFRTYVHYAGDTYAILGTSTDTGIYVTTRIEIAKIF